MHACKPSPIKASTSGLCWATFRASPAQCVESPPCNMLPQTNQINRHRTGHSGRYPSTPNGQKWSMLSQAMIISWPLASGRKPSLTPVRPLFHSCYIVKPTTC
jgi:hypothetical protein